MTRSALISACRLAAGAALALGPAAGGAAGADEMVLVRGDLQVETIRLVEITPTHLVHVDEDSGWRSVQLDQCLALFALRSTTAAPPPGLLRLSDGQRLPGKLQRRPPDGREDAVSWEHPWLGTLEVPLAQVSAIQLQAGAVVPAPGDADTIQLANGDRVEGFILGIDDTIELEVERDDGSAQRLQLPVDRVSAVAMVTPARAPQGRRIWLHDGTVLDAGAIAVRDDGFVRLEGPLVQAAFQTSDLSIEHVSAILFNPHGMRSLASLPPSRVEGPPHRYVVSPPEPLEGEAPLGLSTIVFRGPLTVRYALPPGTRRLAANARLPLAARGWGDYELLILDDDREVFRSRVNADHPEALINVPLRGSELTVELREGEHGPIQDVLHLERAMVQVGSD